MPPLLLHKEEEEVGCTWQVRDGGRAAHLPYSGPCPLPTAHPTLPTAYTPLLQLPPSHNSSQKSHISLNFPLTAEKAMA